MTKPRAAPTLPAPASSGRVGAGRAPAAEPARRVLQSAHAPAQRSFVFKRG